MILTYKYRLNLKVRQRRSLERARDDARVLYNAALEERISAWRHGKKRISKYEQFVSLTAIRSDASDVWNRYPANMGRWVLSRLDDAFVGFFRRLKCGSRPGFPRFRSASRWSSFGFDAFSGIRLVGDRLSIKGVLDRGRVHLHRPLPVGHEVVSAVISEQAGVWYVCLQLSIPDISRVERTDENAVGADWGIMKALTVEDGRVYRAVTPGRDVAPMVVCARRAVSRCKRDSRNRRKAVARVASLKRREANCRNTMLHQIAADLVELTPWVAMEKLAVRNMTASAAGTVVEPGVNVRQKAGLNRSILDGAPARLRTFVRYKAERAGGGLVEVDPKRTSIECAACGASVPKTLRDRVHACKCGFVVPRDLNSSHVIGKRAFGRSVWIGRTGGVLVPGAPSTGIGPVCPETSV